MAVAVVVGGAGDIGRAIVVRLLGDEHRVAVWDHRAQSSDTSADLSVTCDITDRSSVRAAHGQTTAALGEVQCLVNAAGLAQYEGFLDTDPDHWDRIVAVNLNGAANTIREVLSPMVAAGAGTVVNICSIWSRLAGVQRSAYIASKWALLGLTKSLSDEYRASGVRFTAVSPGPVLTEMTRPFVSPDEGKTWMRPADVADAVAFAVSAQGGALVGAEIELPGWGRPASTGRS